MKNLLKAGAAALVGAVLMPLSAFAAAPADGGGAAVSAEALGMIAPVDVRLGTPLVVRNWVLCVSEDVAETLAKARGAGVAQALAAYSDLKAAKSCGQFARLTVVLTKALYASTAADDAQVFSASVNLSGHWASAFVVKGGLPVVH